MAMRTAIEIEGMIYDALEHHFDGKISGALYKEGCRPSDSNHEDAVIAVGNTSAAQIQTGRARLNIYTLDIDNNSGRPVPDKERLIEISKLADGILDVLESVDTDYRFKLVQAPAIIAAPEIRQHFVNITLEFDCITFNN